MVSGSVGSAGTFTAAAFASEAITIGNVVVVLATGQLASEAA